MVITLLLTGCTTTTSPKTHPEPSPGMSNVWGYARMVAPDEVPDALAPDEAQFSEFELTRYEKPSFAVVYLENGTPNTEPVQLTISNESGVCLSPHFCAMGEGADLIIKNETTQACTLSSPEQGLLIQIGPRSETQFTAGTSGSFELFPIRNPEQGAKVFVAPGPFSVLDDQGQWSLRDVDPGQHNLRAWHPRLPQTEGKIHLNVGETQRVDLEMGIGGLPKVSPAGDRSE